MAEYILKDMVEKRGIADQFEIASAATSTEEIWGREGNPVYPPAKAELRAHGIGKTPYTDYTKKRAVQVTKADYKYYDYLLCAEKMNVRNTLRITGPDTEGKVRLMMDFSDEPGTPIADPWYSGDFTGVYRQLVRGCEGLLEYLGY